MRTQRHGVTLVRTLRFGASERGCCLLAFADTFLFAFLFAMHTFKTQTNYDLPKSWQVEMTRSSDDSMSHIGHLKRSADFICTRTRGCRF